MMILRFEAPNNMRIKTFLGPEDPREYLFTWIKQWCDRTTQEWVHLLIHALRPLPTAWYLDAELHQCTCHWKALRDEFLGTFGLIGGIEALDAALQHIETVAWGESHLGVAPEIPNWELRTPSMIKYCSLSPREGKNDPREDPRLELNRVHMGPRPLGLRIRILYLH